MVSFVCDDGNVEVALRALCARVQDYGGVLHEKLILRSEKNSVSIHIAEDVPENEVIMILPKDCLLPTQKYELALDADDRIVIEGHDKDLTEGQVEIMKALMNAFNVTKKIPQHRRFSVALNYRQDPELYENFSRLRGRQALPFFRDADLLEDGRYIIQSFFKTRVLGFKEKQKADEAGKGAEEGAGVSNKRTQVLMPVVEFVNHHAAAKGFLTNLDYGAVAAQVGEKLPAFDGEGITIVKSCPVAGSNEVFVNYGPYDATDTFFNYNFVEKDAMFVRSVPVTVKLPGIGTLDIRSFFSGEKRKDLPEGLKDLAFYMPQISVDRDRKIAVFSHLYIPQERAPRALRRILALALRQLDTGLSEEELLACVRKAENQIIEENMRQFTAVSSYLKTYKPSPVLKPIVQIAKEMVKIQTDKIRRYPFFAEACEGGKSRKRAKN